MRQVEDEDEAAVDEDQGETVGKGKGETMMDSQEGEELTRICS